MLILVTLLNLIHSGRCATLDLELSTSWSCCRKLNWLGYASISGAFALYVRLPSTQGSLSQCLFASIMERFRLLILADTYSLARLSVCAQRHHIPTIRVLVSCPIQRFPIQLMLGTRLLFSVQFALSQLIMKDSNVHVCSSSHSSVAKP